MDDWRLELTVALLALIAVGYFVGSYSARFAFSKLRLIVLITVCEVSIGVLLSLTLYSNAWPSAWLRSLTVTCVLAIGALGCSCHAPNGWLGAAASAWLKCSPRTRSSHDPHIIPDRGPDT